MSTCEPGYFNTTGTTGNICQACSSNCANCSELDSNCTSCNSPLFLYNYACVQNCPIKGYY